MRSGVRRLAVVGLAFVFALLLAPGAAQADESGRRIELGAEDQAEAVEYWTSERMEDARSGDLLLLGRTLKATADVQQGVATLIEGVTSPVTQLLGLEALDGLLGGLLGGGGGGGSLYPGTGAVVQTSGKVFFTMGETNYVCSGSSTIAANRSLVQTAGHCVHEGPGDFATNFVFVPAYRDGQAPYGTFPAAELHTTSQWAGEGDLSYDVGYVVVSPAGSSTLTDTVGAQGIGFNLDRGATMYAFGYPAAGQYNGEKLAWCHGPVSPDTQGTSDQGMNCNMTGGSSGGPWFIDYDESTGVGTLNSLNSFKYSTLGLVGGNKMYGPYFGSVVQDLYNAASQD